MFQLKKKILHQPNTNFQQIQSQLTMASMDIDILGTILIKLKK